MLRLTSDPLALGLTLALGGIPRALIMLIGGAIADRFPARAIMIASDIIRMLLVALLAILTLTGTVQLWMVYVLSFAFGLVDGFFMPAAGSMLPARRGADRPAGRQQPLPGHDATAQLRGPSAGRRADRLGGPASAAARATRRN